MEKDSEFDLAFYNMRDTAKYYVDYLCCGALGLYSFFQDEVSKFESLCKSKGSRVEWFEPHGWDSLGCNVIAEKQGAPSGYFSVQSDHCLTLSPHN